MEHVSPNPYILSHTTMSQPEICNLTKQTTSKQHTCVSEHTHNNIETCYDLGLDPHQYVDNTPSDNVPFVFKSTFDNRSPGFGYSNSDLKNPYLSSEQLNARLISPSINTNNYQNMVKGVKF
jgi:hypothetical protein